MDQGGWEREAAVGWGRRGRRRGAVVVDLDRGEGLGWVADLQRKNGGGGGGMRERMEAGGGWKMSMRTDLGFRLGWVWAVGSGSIRRWLMRDPRDMLMVQSERSKPFDDLMTI